MNPQSHKPFEVGSRHIRMVCFDNVMFQTVPKLLARVLGASDSLLKHLKALCGKLLENIYGANFGMV